MPIYEYEPDDDRECFICQGRCEFLQRVDEEPLKYCLVCGLGVRRIISRPSVAVDKSVSADNAAKKGFSTFKRVGKGKYERIAGDGGPEQFDAGLDS